MVFNLQKFLVKNKLTKRSRLDEDAMTKTDAEQQEMSAEENGEEMFNPDSENVTDADSQSDYAITDAPLGQAEPKSIRTSRGKQLGVGKGGSEIEIDPEAGRPPSNKPVKDLHTKEIKLKALEDQKDALLMQLKSGQLTLDQYKTAIGNIPNQIIKLRADIQQAMEPDLGDEEELA